MDPRFILTYPVHNATFKHWKAVGSAIFLNEKTILTPGMKDMNGMVYAKNVSLIKICLILFINSFFQTFNLREFEIQIDFSVHNSQDSSFGRGELRFFILRDNPMKSS